MHVLELEDLGAISEFLLGMHLLHCNDGSVKIDQVQTIVEMLDKHGLSHLIGVCVSIGASEPSNSMDQTLLPAKCTTLPKKRTIKEFHSLDSIILWLTRCTSPDIAFAVHKVSRSYHATTLGDWKLTKRVARYVSGTCTTFLHMKHDEGPTCPIWILSYTDADFVGDVEDQS